VFFLFLCHYTTVLEEKTGTLFYIRACCNSRKKAMQSMPKKVRNMPKLVLIVG